jgi:multidrug efflux pump subunit AcrA (membrane-fusion protein)
MPIHARRTFDDEDVPFAPSDPPHWAADGLAYVLIGVTIVVAISSIVVTIPETVSGRFVLVPVRGLDPIRAPRKGMAGAVRVAEGQVVSRGESLFVIRSEPTGDRFAELRVLEEQVQSADARATNARRQFESQQLADLEEQRTLQQRYASLGRTVAIKQRQYDLTASIAANFHKGVSSGAISSVEYSRPLLDADQLAADIEQAQAQRDEARIAIDKLRHEMDARRIAQVEEQRALASELASAKIKLAPLAEQLEGTTSGSSFAIIAPCAGTVVRLGVRAAGAVIGEGDSLGEIACAGDALHAEVTVPQTGLSLVRPGQDVKLRYDAFPYQRFGVRSGVVRWIGPGGLVPAESAAFRAFVDLDQTSISVGERPRALVVGMGGRADVLVGRRSLASYAFEPIRQLRENMATSVRR